MARLILLAALLFASPAHAGPFDAPIAEASARFGVPRTWIVRVMRAESRGRIDAMSPKGAMGLMQLMPGTWADMASRLGLGSNPYAPRDNILAGTLYLRLLYDRFGYPGLFAAYNAGPQRYADHLSGRRALPLETRNYVVAVSGAKPPSAVLVASGPSAEPARASLFFTLSGQ